jgi:hypothetical protein
LLVVVVVLVVLVVLVVVGCWLLVGWLVVSTLSHRIEGACVLVMLAARKDP